MLILFLNKDIVKKVLSIKNAFVFVISLLKEKPLIQRLQIYELWEIAKKINFWQACKKTSRKNTFEIININKKEKNRIVRKAKQGCHCQMTLKILALATTNGERKKKKRQKQSHLFENSSQTSHILLKKEEKMLS